MIISRLKIGLGKSWVSKEVEPLEASLNGKQKVIVIQGVGTHKAETHLPRCAGGVLTLFDNQPWWRDQYQPEELWSRKK